MELVVAVISVCLSVCLLRGFSLSWVVAHAGM